MVFHYSNTLVEKFFRNASRLSASFVFLVLIATVTVLYLTARPAIKEFGLHFIIEPRWDVEVPIDTVPIDIGTPDKNAVTQISEPDMSESGTDNEEDDGIVIDDEFDRSDEFDSDDEDGFSASGGQQYKTIYGGAVLIVGTVFSTIIAMLFSIPIALGIAVFLSEIASVQLAKPVGIAIELLAAVPSIIYGMWALFYFGPFIASIFGGNSISLLVAGLVLGVMVIPFMAALSRDAINTTPDVLEESAYAMGATKFEVIKDIIFPYAKAGIIGSIIVSLGRAMGETMAVAFVIGGVFEFAHHITAPTNSIPVVLANNFSESSGISMSSLFYLSLILFVISFISIVSAKHFLLRRK